MATASPVSDAYRHPPAGTKRWQGVVHQPRVRLKKQVEQAPFRIGSWNVGSMTGKGRELVEAVKRRRIDILCVQETKWKGHKSRELGCGYKIIYNGESSSRDGVGIIVGEKWRDNIIAVERTSSRIMYIKIALGKVIWNIMSAYAPQVGCSQEEKDDFLGKVEEVIQSVPPTEKWAIGGDFNAHIGVGDGNYKEVHGQKGYGTVNEEGEKLMEILQATGMFITNSGFMKSKDQMVTYSSGGHNTQIDYIIVRREDRKHIQDSKTIAGEAVVIQHRLLVTDIKMKIDRIERKHKIPSRTKIWRLQDLKNRQEYNTSITNKRENREKAGVEEKWKEMKEVLCTAAVEVCGKTKAGRRPDHDKWWWNEEVKKAVEEKKEAHEGWMKGEVSKEVYKEKKKLTKKAVAKAREEAWRGWYEKLGTPEGEMTIYRVAKSRSKQQQDIGQMGMVRNANQEILTDGKDIKNRWKQYYQQLLNIENERGTLVEAETVQGPIREITLEEVTKSISKMKSGKAGGESGITAEYFKAMDKGHREWVVDLLNEIMKEESIPEEWTKSRIMPIYKQKGDPMECGNYRGIKLLEHILKLYERIIDGRLREIVDINSMQCGFVKGRGTTDAIFIVRQMQEKHIERDTKLYYAFLDLEKAYDRVPRDVIYWSLRRRGVPEKLINIVRSTYEGATTKVRTKYGESDEFEIKVGLHQGSVLSPLLFTVIIDVLGEPGRIGTPWEILFADDLAIVAISEQELQNKVVSWQERLEIGGLRMNATKSEVLVIGGGVQENINIVDRRGKHLKQVEKFKYLGTTLVSEGGCEQAVKDRVSTAWARWRELTGVMCDKKMPVKLKLKIYRTVLRPILLYGAETWALRVKEEMLLERTEMRMLRWIKGISLLEKYTSEEIRKACGIIEIKLKVREARMRWYGHVFRREEDHDLRRVVDYKVQRRRPIGRPKIRWMETVEKDIRRLGLQKEMVLQRSFWKSVVRAADPTYSAGPTAVKKK